MGCDLSLSTNRLTPATLTQGRLQNRLKNVRMSRFPAVFQKITNQICAMT